MYVDSFKSYPFIMNFKKIRYIICDCIIFIFYSYLFVFTIISKPLIPLFSSQPSHPFSLHLFCLTNFPSPTNLSATHDLSPSDTHTHTSASNSLFLIYIFTLSLLSSTSHNLSILISFPALYLSNAYLFSPPSHYFSFFHPHLSSLATSLHTFNLCLSPLTL